MSKAIILFYSFEGNTKKAAKYLSKELNIEYEEIKPVEDLTSKGFSKYFWGGRQIIMKHKPKLMPIKVNLDDYDTVYLGSPIWAGTFTPAIKTLLEDGLLKNKKIKFFYTHNGGPGKAEIKIEEVVNINNTLVSIYGLARVKDGLEPLKDGLLSWAKDL